MKFEDGSGLGFSDEEKGFGDSVGFVPSTRTQRRARRQLC